MKIELVTGATTYEAGINTIKKIDTKNFEFQNIIAVPDAFSMQAEKLVFECLGIKSSFNIKVVGISKLASNILRDNNIEFQRISALEEIFCIYKAVKQCEDKFVYFKKCDIDFCVKILKIIKQFKACGVACDKIKPVGDPLLDKKMQDIKQIFDEYEKLLGEKLDLSRLLELSAKSAQNEIDLSKTNLYFANFDSFTLEIGRFICKLAGEVNSVCIGMAKPLSISQKNSFIYEDNIYKKTVELAKEYGVTVSTENCVTNLKGQQLKMATNLFAFEVEKGQSDYFLNIVSKNMQDEIEFVAKYIKMSIYRGKKLNDFAVAVPDEKYYERIKDVFYKYGIVLYSDDATNLSQTIMGRFLAKCIEIAKLGFDLPKLKYLISNPLTGCEEKEKILTEVDYYCVDNEIEFIQRYPQFEKLLNLIGNLKNCKQTTDFVSILKDLIVLTQEKYQKIVNEIDNSTLYKESSENKQAKELIELVLDKLVQLGQNQSFDILDFENIFLMSLQSVKVETIPSYIDAVFVGNATESYFEDVDTLFVLGASSSNLPKMKNDTGIIDDEDIKKLRLNFAIEPEIKVLNRRARLKLFECLIHAKNKLVVCCPAFEEGKESQDSSFVDDLKTMFGQNILHTNLLGDFSNPNLNEDEIVNKLLFYIGSGRNLENAYSLLKNQGSLPIRFSGALGSLVKDAWVDEKFEELSAEIANKLKKNTVSASELENFFVCPFKWLANYKLKISEKTNIEPDKRLFGDFEHRLLQKFVEENKNNLKNADIDKFLDENLRGIAEKIYDRKVLKLKNFTNYLKKESKIILKNVVYEQNYSKFEPILLEGKIFEKSFNDKYLVGYVDRVDSFGENFRILDYKTGKQDSIRKGLYYGKKLQLFLYAKAIQNKIKKFCSGIYYFDCQTKYEKVGENTTRLLGFTLQDENIVNASDTRLGVDGFKSDIIGMRIKKSAKEGEFPFSYGNPVASFDKYFSYAQKISENAIKQMDSGFVKPTPLEDACKFCPYVSICKHREEFGCRKTQKIDDDMF